MPRWTTSSPIRTARPPFLGRPGQSGGQVPGSILELDERDAGRDGADPAEAQLPSRQRNAAADRERGGGQQRLVRQPRIVADPHVGELDRGREDVEVDAVEGHGTLEELGEPLLRDADCMSVWKRSEFQIEYAARTRKRTTMRKRREVERRWASCGASFPSFPFLPHPDIDVGLHAPGELARELIEVIGLGGAEQGHCGRTRADDDRQSRERSGSPPARRGSGRRPRPGVPGRRSGRGPRSSRARRGALREGVGADRRDDDRRKLRMEDRPAGREVVGRRAGRRRDDDSVGAELGDRPAVERDRKSRDAGERFAVQDGVV